MTITDLLNKHARIKIDCIVCGKMCEKKRKQCEFMWAHWQMQPT